MTNLVILTPADKLAEIRRLYFGTTRQTIDADLARAVHLLKTMNTEDERERVRVYMDGLAQMRSDWARSSPKPGTPGRGKPGRVASKAGRAERRNKKPPRDS
ncbi:MAG: hypothetical protein FJW27_00810 [Acidimicrobiia bacterium]|nr:hypothetical protein [Acidimicrobiia bacterium]